MKLKISLFVISLLLNAANSANILFVATLVSHSHHLWNGILSLALAEKGHNVTLLSHGGKKNEHKNYHVLEITGGYAFFDAWNIEDAPKQSGEYVGIPQYFQYNQEICKFASNSDALKNLMNYPKDYKFDLIIWDITSGECLYPLIKHFGNPPVVLVSPFGLQPYINWIMGSQLNNYVPFYSISFTGKPTFMDRLRNTIRMSYFLLYRQFLHLHGSQEIAKKVFGDDVGDFKKIERSFALALVNIDPNMDVPQALPNNIVSIGGLQAKPAKPLPKDFQKIVDDSKTDIIYFSLGTTVKAEKLDDNILQSFIKCFETLPYTVLWKISNTNIKMPKNVIIKSFMPQSDILAQPKTKLFITHGGLLSIQEAMYHGVPVVGLPFFLDQIGNLDSMQYRKLGRLLDYHQLSPKYVCDNIKIAMTNEYYKNIQAVSKRIKDKQNTPLEKAIFSIEFILRHGTGEHLSSTVRDMNLIEMYNLDLILLGILILTTPFAMFIALCYCCCKKKNTEVQKKVKKT